MSIYVPPLACALKYPSKVVSAIYAEADTEVTAIVAASTAAVIRLKKFFFIIINPFCCALI